jgi:O-antigen/teichoic acid export membrane protein
VQIKIERFLFYGGHTFAIILKNVGSIAGTTAITSGLGFFYWWLAARKFLPETVGLASASISAMLLLGTIGNFGFGTLLMGELRQQRDQAGHLIATALITVGLAGTIIGFLFV